MKTRTKTGAKTTEKSTKVSTASTAETKSSVTTKMTTVSFRTRVLLKKKAEAIFEDLGISTSAAINMFLSQVVRDKGMPFTPSAQRKTDAGAVSGVKPAVGTAGGTDESGYIALEELWNEL